jgi:hypothetical protein
MLVETNSGATHCREIHNDTGFSETSAMFIFVRHFPYLIFANLEECCMLLPKIENLEGCLKPWMNGSEAI